MRARPTVLRYLQAVTDLNADRIGHGTYLLEPDMIADTTSRTR